MDRRSATALQLLTRRGYTIRQLGEELNTSYSRAANIARELIRDGYVERRGRLLQLAKTAKAELAKSLFGRYDLARLFAEDQGIILQTARQLKTAEAIAGETGLSQSAVYTGLAKLSEIGAIRKIGSRYQLAEDPDLESLASILAREKNAESAEPFATVIRSRAGQVLKRVLRGTPATGSLTGFSLFPRFGIDYSSPNDYYVDPPEAPNPEAVVVHALASSESRTDRTICAIFIAKNKAKLDAEKARKLADEWDVLQVWLDAARLADGIPPKEPNIFLPWKEYIEKAELYGLSPPEMQGSDATLDLLTQLGARLGSPRVAYLFAGGNMLLRGLKAQTKDVDLILEDVETYDVMATTLGGLGFQKLADKELERKDQQLKPSGIFVAEKYPRVDLFTKKVLGKLVLTSEMKRRTEDREFGKLRLKLLSLDDVFLFKSITDRVGDLDDMAIIARRTRLNWKSILETYWREESLTKTHFCFLILDNLEILQDRERLRTPIHRTLLQHCIDVGIEEAVKQGASTVQEIKKLVDFPEYQIRNRIRALTERGRLKRQPNAKGLTVTVRSA